MLRGLKLSSGVTRDAYGRAFTFDLAALRKRHAQADRHKAKRTGNPSAVGAVAWSHTSQPYKAE
jgi:hypothetical protein